MQKISELENRIKSEIPLIFIDTYEEKRALQLMTQLAIKTYKTLYCWTPTDGLVKGGIQYPQKEPQFEQPDEMLNHLRFINEPSIFVLCDFNAYLKEVKNLRYLKDLALNYPQQGATVVLIGAQISIPKALLRYSIRFDMAMPNTDTLKKLVITEAEKWTTSNRGARVKTDSSTLDKFVQSLQGLTHDDAKRVIVSAICDGVISEDDLPAVNKAKFELLDLDGLLSLEQEPIDMQSVGGLDNLKLWLRQRQDAFIVPQENLDAPKGVLLLGVQGGGKSLAAKAVASLWGVPVLRLDMGAIFNKYQGETERNMRDTLALADLCQPCVLWMDEIEKGLAQSDREDPAAKRILGTLLTWMSERKSAVFLVATSNDISKLPAELVRKGRFDEIFFVDLPELEVREMIARIHLSKRQLPLKAFDLQQIGLHSEGFSGAEIEQAIVSAMYYARSEGIAVNQQHLLQALSSTQPLSVTMSEQIQALRSWAVQRAVPA